MMRDVVVRADPRGFRVSAYHVETSVKRELRVVLTNEQLTSPIPMLIDYIAIELTNGLITLQTDDCWDEKGRLIE